jgi:hypothetical protein
MERHRKLMDDFMADKETETAEIQRQHQENVSQLQETIARLTTRLEQQSKVSPDGDSGDDKSGDSGDDKSGDRGDDKSGDRGEEKDSEATLQELESARAELATVRQDHAAALQTLTEEHEAKIAGELI